MIWFKLMAVSGMCLMFLVTVAAPVLIITEITFDLVGKLKIPLCVCAYVGVLGVALFFVGGVTATCMEKSKK